MRVYTNLSPFREDIERSDLRTGRDLMTRIDALGFDGVELNLSILERPGGRQLLDGLDHSRVSFHSNHFDFNLAANNRHVREAGVRQLIEELCLARDLGIRFVTCHPGSVGKRLSRDQSHEEAARCLERVLGEYARGAGGTGPFLCLENMDDDPVKLCRTEEEISLLLHRLPGLSLTCDLAHLGMNGLDPAVFVRRFAERIRHFHASGVRKGTPHSGVSLEESALDVRPALTQDGCPDAVVCLENRTLDLALHSLRLLRSIKNPVRGSGAGI